MDYNEFQTDHSINDTIIINQEDLYSHVLTVLKKVQSWIFFQC